MDRKGTPREAIGGLCFAVVTISLPDWPSELPDLIAVPEYLREKEMQDGWFSFGGEVMDALVERAVGKLKAVLNQNGISWQFAGLRWNQSGEEIEALKGETVMTEAEAIAMVWKHVAEDRADPRLEQPDASASFGRP
jgi:hypothetical protein